MEALHEKVRSGPEHLAELWANVCKDEKKRQELAQRPLAEPRVLFQVANGGGQVLQVVLPPLISALSGNDEGNGGGLGGISPTSPLIQTLSGRPMLTDQYQKQSERKKRNDGYFKVSESLQKTYAKADHIKTVLRYSNQDTPLIAKMLALPAAHNAALMAPYVLAGLALFAKRTLFR
jgi:hypothetical protein